MQLLCIRPQKIQNNRFQKWLGLAYQKNYKTLGAITFEILKTAVQVGHKFNKTQSMQRSKMKQFGKLKRPSQNYLAFSYLLLSQQNVPHHRRLSSSSRSSQSSLGKVIQEKCDKVYFGNFRRYLFVLFLFMAEKYFPKYPYITLTHILHIMCSDPKRVLLLAAIILTAACSNLRSQWPLTTLQQTALKSNNDDAGSIFIGFVIGPIAFVLSFVMIWYNEKRAAINKTRLIKIKTLLGESKNKNSNASTEHIGQKLLTNSNPANLIYISGSVNIPIPAQDPISKLAIDKCLRLDRNVEVMQYRTVSNKKNQPPQLGWYSYHSGSAGGRNNDSANWFIKSQVFTAKQAIVDGYKMNQKQMKSIATNGKVTPTEDMVNKIKQSTNRPHANYVIQGQYIYFPAADMNKLSHGSLRVRYMTYKPDVLSIIASHNDTQLQPFRIDLHENKGQPDTLCCQGQSCCCACNAMGELMKPISQVDFVMEGKKSEDEIIETMIATNKVITNILRIVAYFVMVLGIYAFFSPIVEILGYIPLVGGFLKGVAGTLIFLAALIICIPLFLVTFSLAWLVYHPKTGILVLLLAAAIITVIVVLNQVYQDK